MQTFLHACLAFMVASVCSKNSTWLTGAAVFATTWLLQLSVLGQTGSPGASPDFLLRIIQRDDGLPHNTVSALVQAADGYLWIGTYEGLARFDGTRFTHFPTTNTPGLEANHVDSLAAGVDGSVWVGLERGAVARWRGGKFEAIAPLADYTNRITSLTPVGRDTVWAGLTFGRLMKCSGGKVELRDTSTGIPAQGRVFSLLDSDGRMWFASENSFGYIENETCVPLATNRLEFFRIASRRGGGIWLACAEGLQILDADLQRKTVVSLEPIGDSGIEVLYEDSTGALWIGTRGNGLYRFQGGELNKVPTSHESILAICEDSEGDIWVGTWGGGLNRLRPKLLRVYGLENGLPGALIMSLCESRNGSIWTAGRNAPPASIPPDRTRAIVHRRGWISAAANVVCGDRTGGIWLASEQRGLFHWKDGEYKAMGFQDVFIMSLFQDSQTNLWVGSLRQGLFEMPPDGTPELRGGDELREITAIAEDANGTLWVGTQKGTLHYRPRGKEEFTTLAGNEGLPGNKIQVIHADGPDQLWIGTRGGGLVRLKNKQLKTITKARGIPDDDIRQIIADDAGGLWIGCASGLFRAWNVDMDLAIKDGKFAVECVSFGMSHGLDNFEYQEGFRNATCKARDGKLWFATTRGAVEVDPTLCEFKDEPSSVYIEGITVDGNPLPLADGREMEVPPSTSRVEIQYTTTSFSAPENIRFRYKLENLDSDWMEKSGAERSATYFRIPPGKYRFHVVARNSSGIWNQVGANIVLTVKPTLWQTLWFRILAFSCFATIIAIGVRHTLFLRMERRLKQLEQAQALENERRRIARDMHDELGANLTRLVLMSQQIRRQLRLDPEAAAMVEGLSKAATEVSHTLDQIVWTVNPGNDTLEQLIGYLSQYAADFLSLASIRLVQELPDPGADYIVKSDLRHEVFLTFQEAINNAVRHSSATEIRLKILVKGRSLTIQIMDNGKGFDPSKCEGMGEGLRTLRERLVSVGGQCHLESEAGKGTRVTLVVPLLEAGVK